MLLSADSRQIAGQENPPERNAVKTALSRFCEYIALDTQSSETSGTHPSTPGQRKFAEYLAAELHDMGVESARVTKESYVFAEIPASQGAEDAPVLGWISHLDTSNAASGKNVKPQIFDYQGGTIPLGSSGKELNPEKFPFLKRMTGHTLVTTDGTTLLGADDKAGVAEIMTALATILRQNRPHPALRIAFTPDEEIGEGTMFFDVKAFGADFAYTVDGGEVNMIEYQNFNAASAVVKAVGVSVHPGSAKGLMVHAGRLLMELNSLLPANEVPEKTEGMEGFFHIINFEANTSSGSINYILRDFERQGLARRKKLLTDAVQKINRKYHGEYLKLSVEDSYFNMEEVILKRPELITIAQDAIRKAGAEPGILPIRGGTDGAMLSWQGLPCPNLGTGGYNFHGEQELLSVNEMNLSVEIILNITQAVAAMKR